jgi:hypothetical protein
LRGSISASRADETEIYIMVNQQLLLALDEKDKVLTDYRSEAVTHIESLTTQVAQLTTDLEVMLLRMDNMQEKPNVYIISESIAKPLPSVEVLRTGGLQSEESFADSSQTSSSFVCLSPDEGIDGSSPTSPPSANIAHTLLSIPQCPCNPELEEKSAVDDASFNHLETQDSSDSFGSDNMVINLAATQEPSPTTIYPKPVLLDSLSADNQTTITPRIVRRRHLLNSNPLAYTSNRAARTPHPNEFQKPRSQVKDKESTISNVAAL